MGPAFPAEWLWIAIILALIGLFLVWRGWRIRRRGDVPRCRKCDYNLTGLASDRCPECGTSLDTTTIVKGDRYRRWWWAVIGVVFLALAGVSLIKPVQQIDGYRIRPTAWVMSDFQAATGQPLRKAWSELRRRDRQDNLSDRHRQQLIKLCLAEQTRTPRRPVSQPMYDHLAWLAGQDALTESQAQQFFQQVFRLELTLRPRVAPGDDVPFWISNHIRAPSKTKHFGFWCDFSGAQLYIQDQLVNPGAYGHIRGYPYSGISVGSRFQFNKPDMHTVVARGHIAFYHGETGSKENSKLLYERNITARAEFEMLAEEPEDYFTRIDDPALAEELKQCISPRNIRFVYNRAGVPFQGTIEFTNPPVNAAFDVYARIKGKEYRVGQASKAKGKSGGCGFHGSNEIPRVSSCDIILRSSEKVARHTMAMFDMWEGELVFENVPIKLLETQPSP